MASGVDVQGTSLLNALDTVSKVIISHLQRKPKSVQGNSELLNPSLTFMGRFLDGTVPEFDTAFHSGLL